jgi:hypothetical protein
LTFKGFGVLVGVVVGVVGVVVGVVGVGVGAGAGAGAGVGLGAPDGAGDDGCGLEWWTVGGALLTWWTTRAGFGTMWWTTGVRRSAASSSGLRSGRLVASVMMITLAAIDTAVTAASWSLLRRMASSERIMR